MTEQKAPPVLSTPESHIFEDPTPLPSAAKEPRLSDEEIYNVYEVARTAREIAAGGWRRIALQFPDGMLRDGVRVFEALELELKKVSSKAPETSVSNTENNTAEQLEQNFTHLSTSSAPIKLEQGTRRREKHRLYILADTSYGACCVDEIAAEHVDADVVIHYGRSCLSPTARLPVIYVFTSRALDIDDVVAAFEGTYTDSNDGGRAGKGKEEKVILMADICYHSHIPEIQQRLEERGWKAIVAPEVVHDPSSLIPNRKLGISEDELKQSSLFHVSDPPPALLLTLSSRVREMFIYPTAPPPALSTSSPDAAKTTTKTIHANTRMALRRRYALLTSLSTCPIFGILINTLSVRNYLETVTSIKRLIDAAGKKSYTFVVGKVNAAKIANFSEIGGWVVIGCWESSLIESTEFYRPIITPFELSLALQGDAERVWNGDWRGDFSSFAADGSAALDRVLNTVKRQEEEEEEGPRETVDGDGNGDDAGDSDSEEESAPPEFDLRTGRYVSHSRPMRTRTTPSSSTPPPPAAAPKEGGVDAASRALTRRARGDLATVNGTVSPGAEYLRSQRTWTGLGSDFHEGEASDRIEEGRSGVARGYTVGEGGERT